ncbi:MarR family winged helix-turn-helix transcriptional regulator [Afipia birgiae]|jgi:DNA-binding MarR family transcriptional regulator|uniref:MarR family winged helix-turn-helix transcriptional regulator n=1 Tax=Afipia birgiae TaxID=151414 RepID=UPI0002FD5C3F|nr:MarR family winged helix-turn-helix transcriptional regulator [Afipia birgiae]MBX9820302.1 MarR family winged helix-turn-helix transcriptional regulator [Afipia birgiae]
MAISRTASASAAKPRKRPARPSPRPLPIPAPPPAEAVQIGDLSEFLGYSLKRAQLRIFEDFIRCVAPLQLTPAQFSVLMLVETNPGRNQTEIASTLGILRPNFVALLDELESRDLCLRSRSSNDRRSHILRLTEKGRAVLSRARKLIEARHEARLKELLGDNNRDLLLAMLGKIAREF